MVGAAIIVARRAGNTFAIDDLFKYMFINNMIAVGSTYWNLAFGSLPVEVLKDGYLTLWEISAKIGLGY